MYLKHAFPPKGMKIDLERQKYHFHFIYKANIFTQCICTYNISIELKFHDGDDYEKNDGRGF